MIEEWKDIGGYEGLYQVSNLGRVKSIPRSTLCSDGRTISLKGKILAPNIHTDGYVYVKLCKNSSQKNYRVHRLVAMAFIDNPHDYPEVNHLDENRGNNEACNLEWCTSQHNSTYGNCRQRQKSSLRRKQMPFMCIETGETFGSIAEYREKYNTSNTHISDVLKGKRKTADGYTFKYLEES